MKCKNCGADLMLDGSTYRCNFCGVSFSMSEVMPITMQNPVFRIVGGVLLAYHGNQAAVTIPDGTVSIGKEAFKNNLALKTIVFSQTVTSVEDNAFEGCVNLTEMTNYGNVTNFGDECFKFTGLKSVAIGRNVWHIGKGCFSRMPNLETVFYDPETDMKLDHTFAYCPRLADVKENSCHFFPSFHKSTELRNNPGNTRPTFGDVFVGTPFIQAVLNGKYRESYKKGICPECGGSIKKGLFHAKCKSCGVDYKN